MKSLHLALFATLLCLAACYEPRSGCLDPNATNFDVNADRDTGNCVYPVLVVKVAHIHDTVGLSLDSTYKNALGQSYRIRDVAYYMSGFTFTSGPQAYSLQDTFHAHKPIGATDSVLITPTYDIGLVRRNVIDLRVGSFRDVGSFDGISVDFGLRNELVDILPGSVRLGSPLRPQAEMLYDSTQRQHRYARLVLERTVGSAAVNDTMYFTQSEFAVGAQKIQQSVPLSQRAGFDFKVNMTVDYSLWLRNTDLSLPVSAIKAKIAEDIPSSFTFDQ